MAYLPCPDRYREGGQKIVVYLLRLIKNRCNTFT